RRESAEACRQQYQFAARRRLCFSGGIGRSSEPVVAGDGIDFTRTQTLTPKGEITPCCSHHSLDVYLCWLSSGCCRQPSLLAKSRIRLNWRKKESSSSASWKKWRGTFTTMPIS